MMAVRGAFIAPSNPPSIFLHALSSPSKMRLSRESDVRFTGTISTSRILFARPQGDTLHEHPFAVRLLKQGGLNKADLKSFTAILGDDVSVGRGHDFVIDGVECRNFCFIKEGCAIRYRLLRNGKRQIVNVLLPGDVIGLLGSFFERAAFSVTTTSSLVVNTCSRESYTELCYARPQLALALSWIAIHEAAMNAEHVVNLGRRTPIERLSHFLLDVLNRLHTVNRAEADSFILPISQQIMADLLGLSVPHLNKMMQQLRSSNLIADESREIKILDMESLKAIAHYQFRQLAPVPKPTARSSGEVAAAL